MYTEEEEVRNQLEAFFNQFSSLPEFVPGISLTSSPKKGF
jgi:hypothetical protein